MALGWPIQIVMPATDGSMAAPANTKSVSIDVGGPGGPGGSADATRDGSGGGGGGFAGSTFLCNPGDIVTWSLSSSYVAANVNRRTLVGTDEHGTVQYSYDLKGCLANCGQEGYLNEEGTYPGFGGQNNNADDSDVPGCSKVKHDGGRGAYAESGNSGRGAYGANFLGDGGYESGAGTPGQPCSGATSTVPATAGAAGSAMGPIGGGGGGGGGCRAGNHQSGAAGGVGCCRITFWPQDHNT